MSRPAPSARACHGVRPGHRRRRPARRGSIGTPAGPSAAPTGPSWRRPCQRRPTVAWGTPARSATVGRSPSSAAQAARCPRPAPARRTCPARSARPPGGRARPPSIASSAATDPPPADSPNTVTRSGSPPKARMLSRTHSRRRPGRAAPGWPGALDLREPLHAQAVVERHHDDAALPREPTTVVLGKPGHADHVRAALDPHHDRPPRARVRFGRPDVDRQPVVAGRVRRAARPCRNVRPAGAAGRRRRPPAPHPSPAPDAARRSARHRPAARRTGCPGRPPPPPPSGRATSPSPDGLRAATRVVSTLQWSHHVLPLPKNPRGALCP